MILFVRSKLLAARLAWPATVLLLLLQRTPVLRSLVQADFLTGARLGQLLRAALPVSVAAGATHTLTGATQWTVNPASPVNGEVGTELTVAFAYSGGTTTAESYAIIGTLPPGMSVSGASGNPGNLTLNTPTLLGGTIRGTPTEGGAYSVTLRAYDLPNRGLGTYGTSADYSLNFNIQASNAPPAFTTHPQSQTVALGDDVSFTVAVTGGPTPTLQWRKNGANISGATSATLNLQDVDLDDEGDYTCVATNSEGTETSNVATLTVTPPAAPVIETQPRALTVREGSGAFFSTVAEGTGLSYQWRKDGVSITGATSSSLILTDVTEEDEGSYSVRITNPGGNVTSNAVPLTVTTTGRARLVNLSSRAQIGTGGNILIPGFFIGGSGSKTVLARVVGPRLRDLGVPAGMDDPAMQLFRGPNAGESNDDWAQFEDQDLLEQIRTQEGAFNLISPTQPAKDAAMVVTLNAGGTPYTIQARGVGNTTGVGLVELFDADQGQPTSRFINISSRAMVGTGDNVLIAGFFIEGDVALTLLIRGVGPGIAKIAPNVTGLLEDPTMTLFRSVNNTNETVVTNDNWGDNPNLAALEEARAATGAFVLDEDSADGSLLVTLNPGGYTVVIAGKGNTTGVGLMEIFLVGP